MAAKSGVKRLAAARPRGLEAMRPTPVDRVASLLLSSVILVAVLVLLLTMLFLSKLDFKVELGIRLEPEPISGRGDHAAGLERDPDPPADDEVQELLEPSLEQTLSAVDPTLVALAATVEDPSLNQEAESASGGRGDSRPAGPVGEGEEVIPRYQRWDLKFASRNLNQYAEQLDHFGIELGAIGGGVATVDYAAEVSRTPIRRSGNGDQEQRLYFMYRDPGRLLQFDQSLLTRAGVPLAGRTVLKFIPAPVEQQLAELEQVYARQQRGAAVPLKNIAKTVFESQPSSRGGYQWVVIEQRYRNL
jgi:hypothetical protein